MSCFLVFALREKTGTYRKALFCTVHLLLRNTYLLLFKMHQMWSWFLCIFAHMLLAGETHYELLYVLMINTSLRLLVWVGCVSCLSRSSVFLTLLKRHQSRPKYCPNKKYTSMVQMFPSMHFTSTSGDGGEREPGS